VEPGTTGGTAGGLHTVGWTDTVWKRSCCLDQPPCAEPRAARHPQSARTGFRQREGPLQSTHAIAPVVMSGSPPRGCSGSEPSEGQEQEQPGLQDQKEAADRKAERGTTARPAAEGKPRRRESRRNLWRGAGRAQGGTEPGTSTLKTMISAADCVKASPGGGSGAGRQPAEDTMRRAHGAHRAPGRTGHAGGKNPRCPPKRRSGIHLLGDHQEREHRSWRQMAA
jgi:hypothetical protein